MKASIKFREDQKPLFRAKVPLSILGFPFQSGIEAGDTKELCLNFSTFFESGPLIKLSYRPNDSWNPFSLGVKTGIGHFGSPISAPMTMSADFNLLGHGNPSFFLHFRPQIGDFAIRRSVQSQIALAPQSSVFAPKMKEHANGCDSEKGESVGGEETPVHAGGDNRTPNVIFTGKKINGFQAASAIDSLFAGVEVSARTSLPLRERALLNFRWNVRFPVDEVGNRTAQLPFQNIPCLVLSKIGIEHVAVKQVPRRRKSDVAETCLAVKKEYEVLQVESGLLRKSIDELRSKVGAGKSYPDAGDHDSGKVNEIERTGGKRGNRERKTSDPDGFAGKVTDGHVNTGAGI
ncbi:hypothetical protein L1049_011343 [Liquidambar formosana]|uniref:Uncharacterized protein n=1 Tax=Liquidambar formosana TaxID=63359 RepID=A0AAP0RVX0_LIQFO